MTHYIDSFTDCAVPHYFKQAFMVINELYSRLYNSVALLTGRLWLKIQL